MNKYQTLASNTIVLAIGQFSSKLLVYIMLRFYTSMLGDTGFGQVSNIVNASALLISVVTLSISEGVLRYGLDRDGRGPHVLSIGINVSVIGLIIFAAFVPLVGMLPMLKGFEWLIYVYVCTGSIKGICSIYVRASGKVSLFAIDGILTTIINILLNLVLLGVFKLGVVGYVISVSAADLASTVFLTAKAKLYKQYRPLGNDIGLTRDMIAYSLPLMPAAIMWWIINVSDSFMVTYFHGEAANGIYSFAYKFPNLAAIVVGIFSQAWHMSAITERNSRTISNFYADVFSMIQTVMFLTAAGIMIVLRPIIMPFFGSEEFQGAYFYVPFLLIAVVFQSFNNFLSSIYEASNKTGHSLISSVIGAAANVTLNIVLLNTIGIIGAAIATFVSYLIVFIYRVIDTKKYLYMKINWLKIIVNMIFLSGMLVNTMFMDYGLIMNLINSIIFLIICAINFKDGAKAVKQFILNKKGGKGSKPSPDKSA